MTQLRLFLPTCFLVSAFTSDVVAEISSVEIDEVVVTATRRPVSIDDISSAVSVISRDEVLDAKLVTDALASQIGVYLQQTTPGQGAAIIRGLKGSAILHLVDGTPLSNAIFRSAPTPYLALVPTTAVERIEVIRGTPASLYGSQAVGGVVQVVSRVPRFESTETQYRRDITVSFDSAELQQTAKATIDVGNSQLAASLSAEYLSTGNRRIGGGMRIAPSAYASKAARILINATPNEDQSWLFDLHMLEQASTPRVDELVPGFGQSEPSSSEFFFEPSQRIFAHARHTRDDGLLGFDWRVDAAWQRIVDDRLTRDFEAPVRVLEANSSDLLTLSLNVSGEYDTLSWVAGADLQADDVSSSRSVKDISTLDTLVAPSRFPDGASVDQVALFANLDWQPTNRNSINGGLRFTDVQIDVPDTFATDAASLDVRRFSGDIGWLYDINDNWKLLANTGIGFRAPNVFDLGTLGNRPGNRFNIPNTGLDEEHIVHMDFGFRRQTERSRFELMIYALDFTDRILSVPTGDITAEGRDIVQSVNAANSRVHGAEAGFEYELSDRIALHGIFNYTWGEQRIGQSPAEAGDRIPPLSGFIGMRFDSQRDWTIAGQLSTASKQDRLSARDRRDIRIDPAGTPGWVIANATAEWTANDIWRITLSADNLLDHRYRVHGSGIDAPGRNFAVTFRAIW